MKVTKARFALFFGNRGFFPSSHVMTARKQLSNVLKKLAHDVIMLPPDATNHGGVETPEEGKKFAHFLEENKGKYDGIILCLPNFGDENGAVEAFKDVKVPVLIHAYPDDMSKLSAEFRRDSFCGKISMMDVFRQQNISFTALTPHVVDPESDAFIQNIDYFDRVCRTVVGMKNVRVGALGARTTPFKTVRIDEIALQRKGITVETYDLASIIARVRGVNLSQESYKTKADFLKNYSEWTNVPDQAFVNICKLGVVLDEIIEDGRLDCLALRCWIELQTQLGISPCVLMSEMNDRGIAAACEVDIGSAVSMRAISLACGTSPTCLDWNNNYGEDPDKCILFHCGPTPQSMMKTKGQIEDHQILSTVVGKGCSFGCNVGRIKSFPMTYGNLSTEDGKVRMYAGEGEFTNDVVPKEFFGTAGVVRIPHLQEVLLMIGREGFRHHVSVANGNVSKPLSEAMGKYLGYDMISI